MITHEPLPLYEAFSFLTGIANDFSIEEFFEAMYIKHITYQKRRSTAKDAGYCRSCTGGLPRP